MSTFKFQDFLFLLICFVIKVTVVSAQNKEGPPGGTKGWHIMWQDDFNGTTLNTDKWRYNWAATEITSVGFSPKTYLDKANVEVKDGKLYMWGKLNKPPDPSKSWTGSLVNTLGKVDATYGYIETLAKIPHDARGYWPAIWLVPTDRSWPPEIDIMEVHCSSSWLVYQTYHYYDAINGGKSNKQYRAYFPLQNGGQGSWNHPEYKITGGWGRDYHNYAVLWDPYQIKFLIDGIEVADAGGQGATFREVPNITKRLMYYVLDMKMGGWGPDPDATSPKQEAMIVDWVKWWQKDVAAGSNVLHNNASDSPDIAFFPNPASDLLNIGFNIDRNIVKKASIRITDYAGKEVFAIEHNFGSSSGKLEINTGSFNPGFYLISVIAGDMKFIEKLVISH